MNCLNCKAQIASTEIYCPFCGEVNERAGKPGVSQPTVSINQVRCLHCTSMVPQGARFCGSCGREQILMPQTKSSSSSAGQAIAWTCGGCVVILLFFSIAVPAITSLLFGSIFGF